MAVLIVLAAIPLLGQNPNVGGKAAVGGNAVIGGGTTGTIPEDAFVDMEGLSNGVQPTAGTMGSSTHGSIGTWSVYDPNNHLTGATGSLSTLITSVLISSTPYTGTGSLSLATATASSNEGGSATLTLASSYNSVSIGYWISWSVPDNDSSGNFYSLAMVAATSAADYIDAVLVPTGSAMRIYLEASGQTTGSGSYVSVSRSTSPTSPVTGYTLYWITQQFVMNGTHSLNVYRCTAFSGNNCTAVTQVGSTITEPDIGGSHQVVSVLLGITGGEPESAGSAIWEDNTAINLSGTFPVGP